MNFKFPVTPGKVFTFEPTELTIYIGAKETIDIDGVPTEVVNIQSELTQTLEKGTLTESQQRKFPVSILQAIDGFDTVAMKPTINPAAVDAILAEFNLTLTK